MAASNSVKRGRQMFIADELARRYLYDDQGKFVELRLPGDRRVTREALARHAAPLFNELQGYDKKDLIYELIERTLLSERALGEADVERGMAAEGERLRGRMACYR